MRLTLENIGIYRKKVISFPDVKGGIVMVTDLSAAGKTTIARVLYAFLSGKAQTSLIRSGASSGRAVLNYNNLTYTLFLSLDRARITPVWKNTRAGHFLAIVEGSPFYAYAFYNFPSTLLQDIVSQFFPSPKRSSTRIADVKSYKEDLKKKLNEIEAEIARINEQLNELEEQRERAFAESQKLSEYLRIMNKYQELEERAKRIKKEISVLEDELMTLTVPEEDPAHLIERKKSLEDAKRHIEWKIGAMKDILNSLNNIQGELKTLSKYTDILNELNIMLMGELATDAIPKLQTDTSIAQEILDEALESAESEHRKLMLELTEVNQKINAIQRAVERRKEIEVQLDSKRRELTEIEIMMSSLKPKIEELKKTYGNLMTRSPALSEIDKKIYKLRARLAELEAEASSYRQTIRELEAREKVASAGPTSSGLETKRKQFVRVFKETFRKAFDLIHIPDVIPDKMILRRLTSTYSASERLYIATALLTSFAKALETIGEEIPYVVVDMVTPTDKRFEMAIISLLQEIKTMKIVMRTGSTQKIEVIERM